MDEIAKDELLKRLNPEMHELVETIWDLKQRVINLEAEIETIKKLRS